MPSHYSPLGGTDLTVRSKNQISHVEAERNAKRSFIYQHKVWSRIMVVIGIISYIYYTRKEVKELCLARQKEEFPQRGHSFQCDSNYLAEISHFPGCVPKKCGRYISDAIVSDAEIDTLLRIAKRGFGLLKSDNGASVLDLFSGALTSGQKFVYVYSSPEGKELFSNADYVVYNSIKTKIQIAMSHIFHIKPNNLYLAHPSFFSKLNNVDSNTVNSEYWNVHVDKNVYQSFHYTSLLYLSDFEKDFEGGRLVFIDGPKNNITVEPRKGRVVMFTSGNENPHYVEKVKTGTRYEITISFTCNPMDELTGPFDIDPIK